jgi:hypothetical protein
MTKKGFRKGLSLVYNKKTFNDPNCKDRSMEKRGRGGGFGLSVMILMILCLALPIPAQVRPEEEAMPGPVLRVTLADLQVQGGRTPDEVREGFTAMLPAMVGCLQAEYERTGKAPKRIMLRFNLGSIGKVTWTKMIDPPLKTLDACLSKVLLQIKLPPSGDTVSRVTAILEVRLDHLLEP